MMATERKASKPSRKTMMRAGIMDWSFPELHGPFADRCHAIGRGRVLPFPAAGIADAEDLQVVKRRREFFAGADLELALLQLRIVELDHGTAGGADEMIVMRVAADVLVVVVILAEVDAANHPGLHQQFERAVDGGPRDLEGLLLHLEEQLIGLEVVVRGEDLAHQRRTLFSELQSLGSQEVLKAADLA